jgi:hypothetical protein
MAKQNSSGKKHLKRSIAIIFLIFFLTVLSLGCTEELEEPVDKTSIYVYEEEMGQEGDPKEEMDKFFDIALKGDELEITPLQKYAVELDIDPATGVIKIDTMKIYDSYGNLVDMKTALDMQDDIVKDDSGKIITDAAKLDLHIQPIGKNEYKINLPQQMPTGDGEVWKISHDMGKTNLYSGDTPFNDDIIKIGDDLDDMYGGFVRGDYGVIVVDQDTFDIYGGDFGIKAKGDNAAHGIDKEDCIDLGGGLYAYIYKLPEKSASVFSPNPRMDKIESDILEKNNGFAQFRFVKE